MPMQQSIKLSPYMDLYDLIVPKNNLLRQINDLVDFSFVYEDQSGKLDKGRKTLE